MQASSLGEKVAESANVGALGSIPDGFSVEAISARAAGTLSFAVLLCRAVLCCTLLC